MSDVPFGRKIKAPSRDKLSCDAGMAKLADAADLKAGADILLSRRKERRSGVMADEGDLNGIDLS